jgi:quinol monooxygenase YgiN
MRGPDGEKQKTEANKKREYLLFLYQIKTVLKKYKKDEFVTSMHTLARRIRKENGCLGYSVYRDVEREDTYSIIAEWQTRQAMEKHFKTQNYELIIGIARVLCETLEMTIAEVLETGDFNLAREQIALQQSESAEPD